MACGVCGLCFSFVFLSQSLSLSRVSFFLFDFWSVTHSFLCFLCLFVSVLVPYSFLVSCSCVFYLVCSCPCVCVLDRWCRAISLLPLNGLGRGRCSHLRFLSHYAHSHLFFSLTTLYTLFSLTSLSLSLFSVEPQ